MKESELRKLYLSVVNLYGFVFSKDLFKILKHYNVSYKKEQILKDLEKRSQKDTRFYYVQKMRGSSYLIIDPLYSNEEYNRLLGMKKNKPMYFPKTYEDLLKYSDINYKDKELEEGFNNLYTFLKRHIKDTENKITFVTEFILFSSQKSLDFDMKNIFELLDDFNYRFSSEKVINKFLSVLNKTCNNLRLPCNNGFTPNELFNMDPSPDINSLEAMFKGDLKEKLLDGTYDPYEILNQLSDTVLPEKIKNSIKEQLLEIIYEKEHAPAA